MRHDAPEPARRSQSLLVRRNHAALAFCPAPLVDSLAVRTRGRFSSRSIATPNCACSPTFGDRGEFASRVGDLTLGGLSGQVRVNRALPGDGEAVLSLARSPTSPGSRAFLVGDGEFDAGCRRRSSFATASASSSSRLVPGNDSTSPRLPPTPPPPSLHWDDRRWSAAWWPEPLLCLSRTHLAETSKLTRHSLHPGSSGLYSFLRLEWSLTSEIENWLALDAGPPGYAFSRNRGSLWYSSASRL